MKQKVIDAFQKWRDFHGDKYQRQKLMIAESNAGSSSLGR